VSIAHIGDDQPFVRYSNYSHADSKYPKAVERFLELPLSSQAKRKFLWDNCAKLYGFDGGTLDRGRGL